MDIARIFKENLSTYIRKFGRKIPYHHLKAINAIINCRTSVMGGEVYYCQECRTYHYSYHSCQNRHCPKCQSERSNQWLEKQLKKLLPVKYHLVTFTIPQELHSVFRSNKKLCYSLLFKSAAEALQTLLADPKYAGGIGGMIGILHTWTRQLMYHPHLHFIVPGGAFDVVRNEWKSSHHAFLIPVKALSKIYRAKLRDHLKSSDLKLFNSIPKAAWQKEFITHSEPVGKGKSAFKYLSNYVYRIAISNNRIVKYEKGMVTFRYKDSDTNEIKYQTISAIEFMRRFLLHVLPAGFQKVRYYGFMSSAAKDMFEKVKLALKAAAPTVKKVVFKMRRRAANICPDCSRLMIKVVLIPRQKRAPPFFWQRNLVRKQTLFA